jgi:hypothetical protein
MKKITVLTIVFATVSTMCWARSYLPRSAVKGLTLSIYGLYTSTDPTCATGLIATIPISATPTARDMVSSPELGTGPVASPIKCVVLVANNSVTNAWKSAADSGVSTYNVNDTHGDVCDVGSDGSPKSICGHMNETPFWPEQIKADLTAAGLTATTTCAGSQDEIVPIYLSTYAACVGTSTADAGVEGCQITEGEGSHPANDAFSAPTEDGQKTKGIKLTAPVEADKYKFVADPDGTIGYQEGENSTYSCTDQGPPRFSFEVAP